MNDPKTKGTDGEIRRINGQLHELTPVLDEAGNLIAHDLRPLQLELTFQDRIQIIVGATILAIPMAFTEEVWDLGAEISWASAVSLALLSLLFIGLFVYVNSYQRHIRLYRGQYFARVVSTYVFSLLVVGVMLTIIGKAPWAADTALALKRTIIAALPASMSATVTDTIT